MRNRLLTSMLIAAAAAHAPSVHAQVAPDAGQALREAQPPAQLPPDRPVDLQLPRDDAVENSEIVGGATIDVRDFTISGNRSLPSADLLALLADLKGQTLGFGDLENAAARITRYYRDKGYLLARTYVPEQTIQDGVLQLVVLEGDYGEISVENRSRLRSSALAPLKSLKPGAPVRAGALERALLLQNNRLGAKTRAMLEPGSAVGTTNLVVGLDATPLLTYGFEYDNSGNRYTGADRLTGTVALNSPLQLGDQLELRVLGTLEDQYYYAGTYQVPVGRWGSSIGVSYSFLEYQLGEEFSNLDAHGTARTASAFVNQPLLVGRRFGLNARLQYDHRRLDDEIDSVGTNSPKLSWLGTFALEGNGRDDLLGGGLTGFSLSYSRGELTLRNQIEQASDALTARSAGYFSVWRPSVIRLQRLTDRFSLFMQLRSQWSRRNLNGSEKLGLGGSFGVRAYPQGEGQGDDGVIGNLELRFALAESWQLSTFADHGHIRFNHERWDESDNGRDLSAAGVGVAYAHGAWRVQARSAWRLGGEPAVSAPDRNPRFWVQAGWQL